MREVMGWRGVSGGDIGVYMMDLVGWNVMYKKANNGCIGVGRCSLLLVFKGECSFFMRMLYSI